jgi:hypothetical protein
MAGESGSIPRGGRDVSFLYPYRLARMDIEVLSPTVERPGRKTDHSFLSNVEIKNAWSYNFTPPYFFMFLCFILQSLVVIICTTSFNVKIFYILPKDYINASFKDLEKTMILFL